MSAPPLLQVKGVTKGYGGPLVLRGVDLELHEGEGLALLGPNGAGKSTLLRLLAGLHKPQGGRVFLDGQSFDSRSSRQRRRIGFLSHESFSYGALDARENLEFTCRLYGLAPKRAEEVLVDVGLDWIGRAPVRSFSRGMSQRLSLARAMLHRPRLLLLDEPMSGLDPDGCRILGDTLVRLRETGVGILMATHDLPHLAPVANRLGLLARGRYEEAPDCDPADHEAVEELFRSRFERARAR